MTTQVENIFATQLNERKKRLQEAAAAQRPSDELSRLLKEVDRALEKITDGTYGLCEICKESIEPERLTADPLIRYCLDHLTTSEQKALERDIELAHQIQAGLLPKQGTVLSGWMNAFHYEPSGPVSGDYLDIIVPKDGNDFFYFVVGDVTGKGIAASILMSQLHATFRALALTGLPLNELMARANHIFCEASLITHFATLVCGLANQDGEIEICNAGHCLPLAFRGNRLDTLPSSGLPLGIACDATYTTETIQLGHGDGLIVYTDGLSESTDASGQQYGEERILNLLKSNVSLSPTELVSAYMSDLNSFASRQGRTDDLTIMALQRT